MLEVLAGKQHQVRGIGGDALHQTDPEPEVLAFVDGAEGVPGQRTGSVLPVDRGVRVGRQGEDDRDSPFAGHRGGREGADVGHPQVDRVDGSCRAQDPMDAALRRDPPWPRRGQPNVLPHERHGGERVGLESGAETGDGSERILVSPARDRDDAPDLGRVLRRIPLPGLTSRHQRVAEPYEQGGDAAVVAGSHPGEVAIDIGVQEELRDRRARRVRGRRL